MTSLQWQTLTEQTAGRRLVVGDLHGRTGYHTVDARHGSIRHFSNGPRDTSLVCGSIGGTSGNAPQEDILEGECGSTCPWHPTLTLETVGFYQSLGCERAGDIWAQGGSRRPVPDSRKIIAFLGNIHAAICVVNNERSFIIRKFGRVMVTRSLN